MTEDSSATPVFKTFVASLVGIPDMPYGTVATGAATLSGFCRRDTDMSEFKEEEPSHHFQPPDGVVEYAPSSGRIAKVM